MRNYELTIRPASNGGVWLCDDEGNRTWYSSYYLAKIAAGNKLIET
jgi:hypothetical protein